MRKVILLCVLPLLLASCTKTNVDKGQQEVSFATFCLYWKSESSCRKANYASAHTVIEKDSDGWAYINNDTAEDVTPEERYKVDDNVYFFSNTGSATPEHEAITTNKPFWLKFDTLSDYFVLAKSSRFYINPLRIVTEIRGLIEYQDEGDAYPYAWILSTTYDFVFNDDMWLIQSTITGYQKKIHHLDIGWISSYETNNYTIFY